MLNRVSGKEQRGEDLANRDDDRRVLQLGLLPGASQMRPASGLNFHLSGQNRFFGRQSLPHVNVFWKCQCLIERRDCPRD